MVKEPDEYEGKESAGVQGGSGGGNGISRRLKTFDSFRKPAYRIFYGSMLGQWFAMSMGQLVRTLLAYRITHSGTILGTLSLLHAIPLIFFLLFGGAIADRFKKKNILIIGQSCAGLGTLGLAVALTMGYLSPDHPGSWWLLAAVTIFHGIINGIMMPSRQAIIPELVDQERVMNAVSLNNLGMNASLFLGPALAGVIVDALGFDSAYYVMTGMYVIGVAFSILLPRTNATTAASSNALQDIADGVRYIRHERTIFIVLIFTIIGTVLSRPIMDLLPMFTEDILKVSATRMGVLMMVSAAGSMFGSLVLASLPNKKRGLMMLISGIILGISLTGFSFSELFAFSIISIIFIGIGQSANMTLSTTLIQYYAEREYRGRVMSTMMMQFGLSSLGSFIAGFMAEIIGIQWSVGSLGLLLLFLAILAFAFLPTMRRLD